MGPCCMAYDCTLLITGKLQMLVFLAPFLPPSSRAICRLKTCMMGEQSPRLNRVGVEASTNHERSRSYDITLGGGCEIQGLRI